MKILYIAHYKEFGGWSQAATDYILALDKVGVDVVCRNVTLTRDKTNVDKRILQLESKSTDGCDICIQHVLPHHIVGTDEFKKNIAFLASESTSIKHLTWFNNIQQMDEIWVPNMQSKLSLEKDQVEVPVYIVPHTFDIENYKKNYNPISIPHSDGSFKFYYIGDLNDRKNLKSILKCYHSEFGVDDNVSLILKINKFGKSPQELSKIVDNIILEAKQSLRMYDDVSKYKKDITICEMSTAEDIYRIHQYGDCFICPSHGEAWSIPSFEAMAFGNTPICSEYGGPKEFIDKNNKHTGTLIKGVYSICETKDAAFPDIFTGREFWFQPCEMHIRKTMRKYYEDWKKNPVTYKQKNQIQGLQQAEKFSYKNIAEKMLRILNA